MGIYSKDKQEIIQRYNKRLDEFGSDPSALAGGNAAHRDIRYKLLTEVLDLTGKNVLDLGCGFGGFHEYLVNNEFDCEYTGYDINQGVINIAKDKYPEARFEVKDILEDDFPEFDVIVSSSSFNNKLKELDNYSFIKLILEKCYLHAKEAVAVDFLTSYVDYTHDYAFYYAPEELLRIAKTITRRVTLRHDYPLFEQCLYLYKDHEFSY